MAVTWPRLRSWIVRTIRTTGYLVHGMALALAGIFLLAGMALAGVASLVLIGLPWLVETLRGLRGLANSERRRSGYFLRVPIEASYRPLNGNSFRQWRVAVGDPATYRDLLWLFIQLIVGFGLLCAMLVSWVGLAISATIPLWWWIPERPAEISGITVDSWPAALFAFTVHTAIFVALVGFILPWLAIGQAHLAKLLLSPTSRAKLAARVTELTTSRAGALDAHAAELRRIERDLHDTSQASLVAIGIRLGLAERQLQTDPEQAAQLIGQSRDGVERALDQLRTVVRNIYPPILADRGLTGAVTALATEAPIPVTVLITTLRTLPAALAAAAYAVVAEALTNVAKHSQATAATIDIHEENERVIVDITDNGCGGADPRGGTGLSGIQRRVAAFDGTFTLSSPPAGPTVVHVELPCES